jgi:pyruvate/2-oxoglutarate dehydrogenase complex dihydrolipoamide dehydrogenase (E3) component
MNECLQSGTAIAESVRMQTDLTDAAVAHEASLPETYDVVILGGGTGSTVAAWTLASEGKRVAVIDRKYIGGSCPNIACLPSKNIIQSSKVASYVRHSGDFGVITTGIAVDMVRVRERKREMVAALNAAYLDRYSKTGAEFILGSGRFVAPRTIDVALADGRTRRLKGHDVIISTGTRATMDPIPGLAEVQPLTHVEALELGEVPAHLLLLGSGYVGLEFAQMMRRFGSKVTVIGRSARLMRQEDDDVSEGLRSLLEDEGIDLCLNAHIKRVSGRSGDRVSAVVEQGGSEKTLEGTHLMVATGRTPNTAGIGLELAGVELTQDGYIKANERLQTTAQGVWAIGEVAGSPQFTHISIDDARVVQDNLHGSPRVTTGRLVPYCLFTDPELAHVGLSENGARERGISYRLFKVSMEANLRAITMSETRGFVKALVRAETDEILGFTAFGAGAGDIMASVQTAMMAGLPYTALRTAIWAHPTLVEGLSSLFSSSPIHHGRREGPIA